MTNPSPSVGRIVHYVSHGTPGGEYVSECRAAVVTEAFDNGMASLAVLSPGGLFFSSAMPDPDEKRGGTWHWPERVEVAR